MLSHTCGEGVRKRTRECLNPPTINNAIGCDGFPQQTATCHVACAGKSNFSRSHNKTGSKSGKTSTEKQHQRSGLAALRNVNEDSSAGGVRKHSHGLSSVSEAGGTNGEEQTTGGAAGDGFHVWSYWSSWSMFCNSNCLRSRRRECKSGQFEANGKFVPDKEEFDHEQKILSKSTPKCAGKSIDFSNCSFYCEAMEGERIASKIFFTRPSYSGRCSVILTDIFVFFSNVTSRYN